ncbi:MAG: sterol desaturase family protein [Bdellovibrionia bacterium]
MGQFITIFLLTICSMEFAAWALHKYVMHGFLWCLHEDHHQPYDKVFQKNDFFAVFFAVPSFLLILFGSLQQNTVFSALGFGIMAYGALYFFVHEIIIHRRLKFFRGKGWYFNALIRAHRDHHKIQGKEGSANFGMLIAHPRYFKSTKASSLAQSSK